MSNKAQIYFDFNAPITTNLTKTFVQQTIPCPDTVDQPEAVLKPLIYPNPTGGSFVIRFKPTEGKEIRIMLYNLTGQKIYETSVTVDNTSNEIYINSKGLQSGSYVLDFQSEDQASRELLVVY